jgi:hypothetical protein
MFTELQIPAGRRPLSRAEVQISAIAGIAFTIMILIAVFDEFSASRLSVLFILLFWVPMLVLHEAGHALAAKLLDWQVREIVIGFGHELWRWQLGETRIVVKLAPVEGYVLPVPRSAQKMRLKSMLVYAAGPGAELLLLATLLLVLGKDYVFGDASSLEQVAAQSLAIAILLGAGFNLIPFTTAGGVSDGLGIISSPFMSDETIQMRLLSVELRDVARLLAAGDSAGALNSLQRMRTQLPENPVLEDLYAKALAADGRLEEAREYVRQQLADAAGDAAREFAWLKRQARIELVTEEPAWLVFDLAVQKAAALVPASLDVRALRAAAMVLRGQAAEGGEELANVWRSNNGELDDAELLAYLTIAAKRVGSPNAVARFRTAFEQVNSDERLESLLIRLGS